MVTDEIREILRKAYQIEVDGYTFYSMAAEKAQKESVQELFDKLAHDEIQHKAYLKSVMSSYEEKGVEAFNVNLRDPDLKAFTATIFTDRFKEQARGADFEIGVLSIGMTLETNAINHFSQAATTAVETEVREFYEFLADWERQHLDALRNLYDGVRQDFWAEGGFAPY
jgi:rubrerythrin